MGNPKEKSCKYFFGERLRQLRNEKGLSQEALAKDLGISKGSLGFYETCKNTPDIEILDTVSKYFDVSLDYLLGRSTNKTTDTQLQAVCKYTGLSEIAIEIIQGNTIIPDKLCLYPDDLPVTRHEITNFIIEKIFSDLISIIFDYTEKYIMISNEKHNITTKMQLIDKIKNEREFALSVLELSNLEDALKFRQWKTVDVFSNIIEQFAIEIYNLKEGENNG